MVPNAKEVLVALYEKTIRLAKAYDVMTRAHLWISNIIDTRVCLPTARDSKKIASLPILQAEIPYNQHIINLCQARLDVVNSTDDVKEIEDKISCGLAEELINQAEDELELLVSMNENFRVWEEDPEADAEYAEWENDGFNNPLDEVPYEEFEKLG